MAVYQRGKEQAGIGIGHLLPVEKSLQKAAIVWGHVEDAWSHIRHARLVDEWRIPRLTFPEQRFVRRQLRDLQHGGQGNTGFFAGTSEERVLLEDYAQTLYDIAHPQTFSHPDATRIGRFHARRGAAEELAIHLGRANGPNV